MLLPPNLYGTKLKLSLWSEFTNVGFSHYRIFCPSIYFCTMSTAPQTDKGEEDVIVGHGGFIFKHFLHSDARLSKLKTNEDP